jgi:hypothetical protein
LSSVVKKISSLKISKKQKQLYSLFFKDEVSVIPLFTNAPILTILTKIAQKKVAYDLTGEKIRSLKVTGLVLVTA